MKLNFERTSVDTYIPWSDQSFLEYKEKSSLRHNAKLSYSSARRDRPREMDVFDKKIEQIKKEFSENVEKAVKEGWLPKAAEENLKRIDHLFFYPFPEGSTEPAESADHDELGNVGIGGYFLEPGRGYDFKKTVFHEMLHEISGIIIRKTNGVTGDSLYSLEKIGLRHTPLRKGPGDGFQPIEMPTGWLNEAVTEFIAIRLMDTDNDCPEDDEWYYNGSNGYIPEREELEQLFQDGISEIKVFEAYFENHIPVGKNEYGPSLNSFMEDMFRLRGEEGLELMILNIKKRGLIKFLKLNYATEIGEGETIRSPQDTVSIRICYANPPFDKHSMFIFENPDPRVRARYLKFMEENLKKFEIVDPKGIFITVHPPQENK